MYFVCILITKYMSGLTSVVIL